jgi:hypothetical protein
LAVLLAFSTSCSPFKVRTVVTPGTDLSAARTYGWTSGMQTAIDESKTAPPIGQAIDTELQRKGYRLEPQATADFYVSYRFQSEVRVEGHAVDEHPGQDVGWFSSMGESFYIDEHRASQLRIIVYDPSGKRQVWQGFATGRLAIDLSPAERDEVIREAVEAILSRFPPK